MQIDNSTENKSNNDESIPGASEEALRRAREWGRNHRTIVLREISKGRPNIEFPQRLTRHQEASRRAAVAQSKRYRDDPGNTLTSSSSSLTNSVEDEQWYIDRLGN